MRNEVFYKNVENCFIKELPENFFQRVLELELMIKKEFKMHLLQELTYLYSTAIEYYESLQDERYQDYQIKLNHLLSRPDIVRKMSNPTYYYNNVKKTEVERRYKSFQAKKQIKVDVNYKKRVKNLTRNESEINRLLSNSNSLNIPDIVEKDLMDQKQNFISRMHLKKKGTLNRTEKAVSKNDLSYQFVNGENLQSNDKNCNIDEGRTNNILSESFTETLEKKNSKVKYDFEEIKSAVDNFIMVEKICFYKKKFSLYKEKMKILMNQKFRKLIEINDYYSTQIKDIEIMMTTDQDDEIGNTAFKKVVLMLNEELKKEIEKVVVEYDTEIERLNINNNLESVEDTLSNIILDQVINILDLNK